MKLSIIVVSYNTSKLTIQCLKSILNEGSKIKKEIIVVDNASTDKSVELITKLFKKVSEIKLISNKFNLGFSKANNQGIKLSKGEYKLLLNSDTKVTRGTFEKLINFAESTPNCGVVGARLLNSDGSIQESCFNFPTIYKAILQYWFKKSKILDKFAPHGKAPVKVDAVVGAAFLITPQALMLVGMLDERYFFFYEDLEYCRKIKSSGLDVYHLPTAEVFHYHGASGSNLVKNEDQWRRLIPSSKIYHGLLKHYIFNFVLWTGQKW